MTTQVDGKEDIVPKHEGGKLNRPRHAALAFLVTIIFFPAAGRAVLTETCLTGTAPDVVNDLTQVKAVRALVDAACSCANFDGSRGKTHANYVACAMTVVSSQIPTNLRSRCKQTVRTYYARSTCGTNPNLHSQPCIQTSVRSGKVTCTIKGTTRANGVTTTNACTSTLSLTRVTCSAHTQCIEAADTNGDLVIAAPGDSGLCAPPPTATATPTSTPTPPFTPTWTATPTSPPTVTPTGTPTFTPTFTPTSTATSPPTATPTDTPTFTPTETATPTSSPTETATDTPTAMPTDTPTDTRTNTPTWTPTKTPTVTPTADVNGPTVVFNALPAVIRSGQYLTATGTSDPSGVASVTYKYCAGVSCTPSTTIDSNSTGLDYLVIWSAQPADGTYQLSATAVDNFSNASESARQTVIIDNTAPTSTLSSPASVTIYSSSGVTYAATSNYAGETAWPGSISGTASDATSNVQLVRVSIQQLSSGNYWNGANFTSASEVFSTASGTTSWSLPFPSANFPAGGTYKIRTRATDAAGNTDSASQVSFYLDYDPSKTTFVNGISGSDLNDGLSPATAKATISGAAAIVTNTRPLIAVVTGIYNGTVTISGGTANPTIVRGGYDFTFLRGASGSNPVTINGSGGINTTGVLVSTYGAKLQQLTVNSGTPGGAGSSAYGIRALSGATVDSENCTISAATGVAGTNSTATTASAASGCIGNNGGNAGGPSSPGGGAASCGGVGVAASGAGGTGGNYSGSGDNGSGGGGGASGGSGGCGSLFGCGSDAGGGAGGAGGSAGSAGAGGVSSTASAAATWVGQNGGAGGSGTGAAGGGGGGGGKSASASGGGGGAGGGGGSGGSGATDGGSFGGGSFGVYAYNATVNLTNVSAVAGTGGAGGAGAVGGAGGAGGHGGSGGSESCCSAGPGGGGGGGGSGGGGGGAGGGAGGPSVTAFHIGTGALTVTGGTLSRAPSAAPGGAGGSGGAGGGAGLGGGGANSGGTGVSGVSGTTGNNGAPGILCTKYDGSTCTP